MFVIKPEYNPAVVQAFCLQQGVPFSEGTFMVRRYENEQMNGWATFRIENKSVMVTGVSNGTPVDIDLFLRSGFNSAQLRGCEDFSFDWGLWAQVCDLLIPLGYTNQPTKFEDFFTSCCHN